MKEMIIDRIRAKFGQPDKFDSFSNFVKVQYHRNDMYELSFEVSESGMQLFINETGPIIGDSSLNNEEDVAELMKEISVILSNPIKQTSFLAGKNIRKTKFTYKAILGDEIVNLSYTGGRYSLKDLFAKKKIKEVNYGSWLVQE